MRDGLTEYQKEILYRRRTAPEKTKIRAKNPELCIKRRRIEDIKEAQQINKQFDNYL